MKLKKSKESKPKFIRDIYETKEGFNPHYLLPVV